DCEGMTFLLVSMIRNRFPHVPVYATVGFYQGYGHVWTSIQRGGDWLILEATLSRMPEYIPTEREAPEYEPVFRFNDRGVIVVTPELYVPERVHEPGKDRAIRSWYWLIERQGV